MTGDGEADLLRFPRCRAAGSVADACDGLVDDLWEYGALPSIYLLVDGRLRCQAARGYFQVVDGFLPGTGVIGRVVATGRPLLIEDVRTDPNFIAAIPGLRAEGCWPVLVGGHVVGAVNLESHTTLPPGTTELLEEAAALLGERIEAAGGLPAVPLAQRLARIVVQLTSSTDAEEIRARAVEGAVEVSGMTSAALSGRDESGRWTVQRATGPLADTLCGWADDDHRVIADWVHAGTASHFPGSASPPPGYEFLLRADVRAISVQPLVVGGAVTGLLTTADTRPVPHDATIGAALELLAAQTATSLATAAAIEELSRRAVEDPLTGLYNAAVFSTDLEAAEEAAAADGTTGASGAGGTGGKACLFVDIDHFKSVNDTYGHPAGDRLLRGLAAELATELRGSDTLYRIGGDEFAVLATVRDRSDVAALAQRLLVAARRVRTTISVGATLVSGNGPQTTRLAADRALYAAKSAGRDQYVTTLADVRERSDDQEKKAQEEDAEGPPSAASSSVRESNGTVPR